MATGRIGNTPVLTTRWSRQPAPGTTSLSGLDDNSVALVYSVGYEQVYRNGTLLSRGNDYTATNGTTITLVDATLAGDVVEVFANATVPLTDTYSQAVANSLFINQSTFDAKGDLIAGTGDNAYSKLTVGANGDTLVADSSTATGLRYNPQNALANPVINGGFDIWQRGTSVAATASISSYQADRWQGYAGSSNITVSRQTVSDSTNLPNIQYAARCQRTAGNTATGGFGLTNNFESVNSIPFAGKTITLSFYARAGANFSATSSQLGIGLYTGTGTDQNLQNGLTGQVNVIVQNASITTTWQRFAYTATLSSTLQQICVQFGYTPTGTAGANDWFEVTGVQIDLGTYTASTAPTFRRSGGTMTGELAACQRYYWRSGGNSLFEPYANGFIWESGQNRAFGAVEMPVIMRTNPTSLDFSNLTLYDGSTNTAVSNVVIVQNGTKSVAVVCTTVSSLTSFRPYALLALNTTSSFLGFSAEL